jgi:hypothetical protein
MQLTIRVDQGEGPVDVTTNLFTIVAWERKYKRKASDMGNGIGIEDLAYLAHQACQQHNVVVPIVLDDFIKRLVLLEVVNDEQDRPTMPVPTDSL